MVVHHVEVDQVGPRGDDLADLLAEARQRILASGRDIWLEVDGGIKADNIAKVAAAGADTFVAGSAIFNEKDRAQAIRRMREELKRATIDA